jgi:hypothetical protein
MKRAKRIDVGSWTAGAALVASVVIGTVGLAQGAERNAAERSDRATERAGGTFSAQIRKDRAKSKKNAQDNPKKKTPPSANQ